MRKGMLGIMLDMDMKTSLASVDTATDIEPWLNQNNRKRT